jgi:aconitate hydratase 2/2-methylisocitrate dehydratase
MLKQFGGENVFQGRIIEVHLGTLTADQALLYRLDGWDESAKASICISEDDTLIKSLEIAQEESRSWSIKVWITKSKF